MNANHYYQIGKGHDTCEDYAQSGVQGNFAYAIVCDGCSSSPDVDFGARMLALSAKEALRISITRERHLGYSDFGETAIRRADTVSAILTLIDPQFLDATLLVAWVDDGKLTAYMYGDGVFFHRTTNSLRAIHVNFKVPIHGVIRGAPAYLSYYLDPERKENYENTGGVKEVYDCIIQPNGEKTDVSGTTTERKLFEPVVIEAPVGPGDLIAVCSDGINSFRHPDDTMIPWTDLIQDYVGFKNYEGVFVQRRMTAFERKCQKQLITHLDDISIAAIIV